MDDQQNRRAGTDLHAGTEREAGCNREGGDVGRVSGRRKRHLTAQIKPATRNAIMDQLALAADEIERLNLVIEEFHQSGAWELGYNSGVAAATRRPWYARLMWWRK